jgi:hypothetical protein
MTATALAPEPEPKPLVDWLIPSTESRACGFPVDDPAALSLCNRFTRADAVPVNVVGLFCQPCLDAVTLAAAHALNVRRRLRLLPDVPLADFDRWVELEVPGLSGRSAWDEQP